MTVPRLGSPKDYCYQTIAGSKGWGGTRDKESRLSKTFTLRFQVLVSIKERIQIRQK
jgi:hypothetical protein